MAEAAAAPSEPRGAERRAEKRGWARTWLPVEDVGEAQPKKHKSDYTTSEHKRKDEEVSAGVTPPAKTARKHHNASVVNASPVTKAAEETRSTASDPSSERPAGSVPDVEMLQVGTPCGTSTLFEKETLSCPHKTFPRLSSSKSGKCHSKRAPDSTVAPRSPIRELVTQPTASEGGKMGRLLCTAEEGVKRGEKCTYSKLVEMLRERYYRSRRDVQPPNCHSGQPHCKEPASTESRLEERKQAGGVKPCQTPGTGIRCADVCSSQWPQRSDTNRYYTPAESSCEQGRAVKRAIAGEQRGADPLEDVLLQPQLASALPKKSPVVDKKEKLKLLNSKEPAERFPPLTQAMEREVSAAFGRGEADEVLSSAYKLRVTREDIGTLENFCWLNDEVINFYMNLLMERSKKEGYPSVHVFSTFFYPKLISGGHKAVGRWTKAVDIFKQDLIFVPIHLSMHWTLGVIDVRRKSIRYLDSLGQKGNKICETLFKYLQEESRQKRNLDLAASEWTLFSTEPHEIPQQQNGSDCGVFMCKYADYISRDKPMAFTQNHMPYFRKRMVWEILHQQLL